MSPPFSITSFEPPTSPTKCFQPVRSYSTVRMMTPSPNIVPPSPTPISTSDLLQISLQILSSINTDRIILRQPIVINQLDALISRIDRHIQDLSLTIENLDHKLTRLAEQKKYEALNLDALSQKMHFLSLLESSASELSFIDPSTKPCENIFEKKSQKIQQKEHLLKTALLSLCQYNKILHGLQEANHAGCLLGESIQIPLHLHKINDYIFSLGEDFQNFEAIGEGAWGTISKCSLAQRTYVIKTPKKTNSYIQNMRDPNKLIPFDNNSKRDIYIPLILSHPNIIKICGIFEEKPILEYIKDGSLANNLASRHSLSDTDILSISTEIASAIAYMHKQGLIHKDLKPDNILLEKTQDSYRPVLCDFGTTISKHANTNFYAGTELYLAPEMMFYLAINSAQVRLEFSNAPITEAVDVWAFGHILYQMISGGRHLFTDRAIGVSTKGNPLYQKQSSGCATICYSNKEQYTFQYLQESCIKSQKKSKKGVKTPSIRDALLHITSACLQKKLQIDLLWKLSIHNLNPLVHNKNKFI